MTGFQQDVRHALRVFRKAPVFSLVALATLALGIGANTAIFSVVHALLLSPLPYAQSDRLVTVWQDLRGRGGPVDEWATPGNYVDWKARSDVFAALTAVRGWSASLSGIGQPEPLVGEQITHEYFDVLGVRPSLGRAFTLQDDVPNAARVAIIGHGLWMRDFGGDAGVIGRTVMLSGEPHQIVGVMPPGFRPAILMDAEVWRPARLNTATPSRGAVVLRIVARLRPGVTLTQASATLADYARTLERAHPDSNLKAGIALVGMHERVVAGVRPALLALLSAVGFVLLIACVNVANLLLARASSRGREIAVRMALGAARRRIVRQLLTESVLLAAAGGGIGVLLGSWGVALLLSAAPAGIPRVGTIGVNGPVLAFAAAVTLLTGLLFGLAPAWHASRDSCAPALKEGGRGATTTTGQRTRQALIVGEVALALMLLVGGGLLLRTFVKLQGTSLGFAPDHLLTGFVQPTRPKYASEDAIVALYDRLVEGASALPGVRVAALSSVIPLGGDSDTDFEIEGRPRPPHGIGQPVAWYRIVSAGYFDAMGITRLQGRLFAARESAPSIVINESMALKYWPGEDPIGRHIRPDPSAPWFSIIGVVNDVKVRGAQRGTEVEMYVPYWQIPEAGINLVLKTATEPALLAGPMRRLVASIDPDMPVASLQPMDDLVAEAIQAPRFFAAIAGLFGVVALVLAGIGIYGVMAFSVAQRRAEIGVRLALGAAERQIFGLVVGESLRLAAVGLLIGAAAALAVGRALRQLLFGVSGADPLTFAATASVLLVVAFAASYLPARRAMRTDPMQALRVD